MMRSRPFSSALTSFTIPECRANRCWLTPPSKKRIWFLRYRVGRNTQPILASCSLERERNKEVLSTGQSAHPGPIRFSSRAKLGPDGSARLSILFWILCMGPIPSGGAGHGTRNGFDPLGAHRLGPGNRRAQCSIENELSAHSQRSGDAEQYGVVIKFCQSEMVEQRTGDCVHIGPGIFGLTLLFQYAGDDGEDAIDDPENFVVRADSLAELVKSCEARIRDPQHSVAIPGDDVSFIERVPGVLAQLLVGRNTLEPVANGEHEVQAFLIGQPVERPGQAIEARRNRVVGIGESRAHRVASESADVSALVV